MPRLLPLAAVFALLLFGCVSEPRPQEGVQGQLVQNAEGLIGEVQPAVPQANPAEDAEQPMNCTLAVKQATLVAGEGADVSLRASFSGSAQVVLECGNVTRRFLSENTLTINEKCRFGEPGEYNITASVDGRQCASAALEVRKKAGGQCGIDNGTMVRDFSSHTYVWTVLFDGFSDGDTITWVCDNTVAKKKIFGDPIFGLPRYEILSCDFPGEPRGDYINVSISGVPCGQVHTRQ